MPTRSLFCWFSVAAVFVERRVAGIEVVAVEPVGGKFQSLAEALEVHDFTRAQEFDGVAHVGVVGQAQDVVVGHARLLFRREVFGQVADDVALGLERFGRPRHAAGGDGVKAGGVVDKILVEALLFDLVNRQVARELVDDGADHFDVAQLLRADVGQQTLQFAPRHGEPLAEVAHRGAQFAVSTADFIVCPFLLQ